MTETADDLSAPLGQDKPRRKRRLRLPFTAMQAVAVMLDGHVEMLDETQLRDMRRWSNQAAELDNPNFMLGKN